jgi:hypothetical protein
VKKPYSFGKYLIKPSLFTACNEKFGQSAPSKMLDIRVFIDIVEKRISVMAEGTER